MQNWCAECVRLFEEHCKTADEHHCLVDDLYDVVKRSGGARFPNKHELILEARARMRERWSEYQRHRDQHLRAEASATVRPPLPPDGLPIGSGQD